MQDEAANLIHAQQRAITETVAKRQFERYPELEAGFGTQGWEQCRKDNQSHCMHLAEAVRFEDEALFLDYVSWAKVRLLAVGIKEAKLHENLVALLQVIRELLPVEAHETAARFLEAAIHTLPSMPDTIEPIVRADAPHGELALAYLGRLLDRDTRAARLCILESVRNGPTLSDIYNDVFAPCLQEVGRLWQMHKITEAEEHYCTETTHTILSVLSGYFPPRSSGRTAIGFCVAGERHTLGIRLALDYFGLQGWATECLGGDVPTDNIHSILQLWEPDVVLISVTMIYHLTEAKKAIDIIRSMKAGGKPIVAVGGRPFQISPSLWREVGADVPCGVCSTVTQLAQTI